MAKHIRIAPLKGVCRPVYGGRQRSLRYSGGRNESGICGSHLAHLLRMVPLLRTVHFTHCLPMPTCPLTVLQRNASAQRPRDEQAEEDEAFAARIGLGGRH